MTYTVNQLIELSEQSNVVRITQRHFQTEIRLDGITLQTSRNKAQKVFNALFESGKFTVVYNEGGYRQVLVKYNLNHTTTYGYIANMLHAFNHASTGFYNPNGDNICLSMDKVVQYLTDYYLYDNYHTTEFYHNSDTYMFQKRDNVLFFVLIQQTNIHNYKVYVKFMYTYGSSFNALDLPSINIHTVSGDKYNVLQYVEKLIDDFKTTQNKVNHVNIS